MINIENINFEKGGGLVPAIVQDSTTNKVLMMGYMNKEAIEKSHKEGLVTFYSRSKERLWTKGEESGNHLVINDIMVDCDDDTILIKASPRGPVCHTGSDTCWNEKNVLEDILFLNRLETIIEDRRTNPSSTSYTSSLFKKGINKIAQKVGEEAVELVIEAKDDNKDLFNGEAADLIYHLLILLRAKDVTLAEIVKVLENRHADRT